MFKIPLIFLGIIWLLVGCTPSKSPSPSTSSSRTQSQSNSSSARAVSQVRSLLSAVTDNNLEQTKQALKAHPTQLDRPNSKGETPLLVATHNNNVQIAKLLIDHDADVNLQDHIQDSAYLYAAAQGRTQILDYILKHTEPNPKLYNRFGGTALIPAAEKGHLDNVRLLLKDGHVDINHQNKSGYTALIEAVALRDGSSKYQQIVQLLLDYGAKTDLRDNRNQTALDYAKQLGFTQMVNILENSSN